MECRHWSVISGCQRLPECPFEYVRSSIGNVYFSRHMGCEWERERGRGMIGGRTRGEDTRKREKREENEEENRRDRDGDEKREECREK